MVDETTCGCLTSKQSGTLHGYTCPRHQEYFLGWEKPSAHDERLNAGATMALNSDLAKYIVGFLNDLLRYDPDWVNEFFQLRGECNKRLAEHPSVQVLAEHSIYWCGVVGLLNGLCGKLSDDITGPIAMVVENGRIIQFIQKEDKVNADNGSV